MRRQARATTVRGLEGEGAASGIVERAVTLAGAGIAVEDFLSR